MPYPLNWSDAERTKSVNHTKHDLQIVGGNLPPGFADDLFIMLRDFVHFDGGNNGDALVSGKHDNGAYYAMFDTVGVFGFLSSLVNPHNVPVRISCDSSARLVIGDTAGNHMLIGQRRWWVETTKGGLAVKTESHDRPRDFVNRIGMVVGKIVQHRIWQRYLENILERVVIPGGWFGQVNASPTSNVPGNPWPPVTPYTECDGRI